MLDWMPNRNDMQVHETSTAYIVSVDLPGLDESDVKLGVNNRLLTLSVFIEFDIKENAVSGRSSRNIRRYKNYKQCVRVPEDVVESEIQAHMENGVLDIRLPKVPFLQPRQIHVTKSETLPYAGTTGASA
uniref:Hsp20 alpha crystallin n=1 Tax=Tetraselmis sp. GSL018 TaxID=582737 RepID=A0A061SBL2_9CHLO